MEGSGHEGGAPAIGVALAGKDCHDLFVWLWDELSSAIGAPATAALLRRAIASLDNYPALRRISITRERLSYTYSLPADLGAVTPDGCVPAYRALARTTVSLVGQLTGGVMAKRLARSEELIKWQIAASEGI